ncbi:ParB/RepB/Spo0J family partition protein [Streptomyces sp. NPDC001750]|uniref:ParB/RepB/Spo0J family partition protein n=1 Tax=Streptomyces sp. NPDC001750 TaxID=3364607 RepID=UPI003691C6DF
MLSENVERANFNFIEEARGLQQMLEMSDGNQTKAAEHLSKSKQWFSQRIGILRLTEEMQALVLEGKLTAFRDMRKYSALPPGEQMAAWEADRQATEEEKRPGKPSAPAPRAEPPAAEEPAYTAVYAQPSPTAPIPADEPVPAPQVPSRSLRAPRAQQPAPSGTASLVPAELPDTEHPPIEMPGYDGRAAMDIFFQKLSVAGQLSDALGRYYELVGDPEKAAKDIKAAVDPEFRNELAQRLLEDT